ncbi:MAG: discoidin domain-containing protein [Clostridia bacterium]|nr:discoidin domain-containing protein [Clostridia bacterium]
MKKIALLLSLILVICAVFAACGEPTTTSTEESKADESVAESVEESAAEPEESEAEPAESEAEPEESEAEPEESEAEPEESEEEPEESEEEPEESEEAPAESEEAPAEPTNYALNKKYTVSGSGHGYIVSEGQWPCHYDANLTDGVISDKLDYSKDVFFSINPNAGDDGSNVVDGWCFIKIDLGKARNVNCVRIHMAAPLESSGIIAPNKLVVALSADNTEFTDVAEITEFKGEGEAYWVEIKFKKTSAQYVQFGFVNFGGHVFIDELGVYKV